MFSQVKSIVSSPLFTLVVGYMVKLSIWDKAAEKGIVTILEAEGVIFRNEFRYRLENPSLYQLDVERAIEHSRVDAAIKRLERKGVITPTGPLGRKPRYIGGPRANLFYRLNKTPYSRALQDLMRKKIDLSYAIFSLSSYAGFYAQNLWLKAFRDLNFDILGTDVSELEGKKASVGGDIDFVAEKDGVRFGVEVKNGLSYPTDFKEKFQIAAELDTIPLFVARRLPSRTFYWIVERGGLVKIYETAIHSPDFRVKINECIEILGYPLIILSEISEETKAKLYQIARIGFSQEKDRKNKIRKYLSSL